MSDPHTPGGRSEEEGDRVPLTDPAHRAARWSMVLAPVFLVIVVYLILRLSTG